MDVNNVNNGANKAFEIIQSQKSEETIIESEQELVQEQTQVREQAEIEESELQETEFAEEETAEIVDIGHDMLTQNTLSATSGNIYSINSRTQNPVMQMMQKLMQMMMQLLQMMMGKINDEPPEKPQPIEIVDLPVKSLYSIPELD